MNTPEISKQEFLEAIKDGVYEAVRSCIMNATDCPTADILDEIRAGVREAFDGVGALMIDAEVSRRKPVAHPAPEG